MPTSVLEQKQLEVMGNIKTLVNRCSARDIRNQQTVFIRVNTGSLLVQ
jgi:hypothetical protein